jgi:hypothetical protein
MVRRVLKWLFELARDEAATELVLRPLIVKALGAGGVLAGLVALLAAALSKPVTFGTAVAIFVFGVVFILVGHYGARSLIGWLPASKPDQQKEATENGSQASTDDLVPTEFSIDEDVSGGHLWLKLSNQKSEPKGGYSLWVTGGRIYSDQHHEYRPYRPLSEMPHHIRLRRMTGQSGALYWNEPRSYELMHTPGAWQWTLRGGTEHRGATTELALEDGRFQIDCELRWQSRTHQFKKDILLNTLQDGKKSAVFVH